MHTIHYSSSRKEVWRWYWRQWARPRGFWLFHAFCGLLGGVLVSTQSPIASRDLYNFASISLTIFLFCVILLPLWPQIKFKPSVRTLSINQNGIETTVGNLSGARAWREIAEISDNGQEIIILGKNKNAFIVPQRAFAHDSERKEFLQAARSWRAAASA